jgi:DNA-binding XRE family transcriptional regulator
LEKQILSAASKERRSGGDLLEVTPMPPGSYLRRSSAHFRTLLVKEVPTTRRVRMIERSRSTPLSGLAEHRRRRSLTQRQLGELASVAHTTVQQLESLRRGAYPQSVRKLATALGVAPEELLHGGSTER